MKEEPTFNWEQEREEQTRSSRCLDLPPLPRFSYNCFWDLTGTVAALFPFPSNPSPNSILETGIPIGVATLEKMDQST